MPDLFWNVFQQGLNTAGYLLATLVALACGALLCLAARVRANPTTSFLLCLMLLPCVVQTVILMVNGNVGTGVAVAGAFSLVRFRSVPGRAREIALIFAAMTAGLTCSAGYLAVAGLITLLAGGVTLVFSRLDGSKRELLCLKITVPESLNFVGAFEDLFDTYTSFCRLDAVKTVNMGSLYKLSYSLRLKDPSQMRELMENLRCRNGNLELHLFQSPGEDQL